MELVVSAPFGCSSHGVPHEDDEGKELHGSMDKPIPVDDTRAGHYVKWEYEHMGRVLPPFNRCYQQLFEDREKSPRVSVDRLVVRDISGKHHVFYFDVSIPINTDLQEMEKAWKDYQAGKPIDPKRRAMFEKALDMQKRNSRIVHL
jgi:hypothetical protein